MCAAERWAAASGGELRPTPGAADPSAITGPDGMPAVPEAAAGWIRAGAVKAPLRAIEKGITCFFDDVSWLVDAVRTRVVFEAVGDLAACLRAVRAEEPAVEIVRIKNGLFDGHDSWFTAGFRVRGSERDGA